MSTPHLGRATEPGPVASPHKLLVSGWIHLGPPDDASVEVRREMTLVGSDGAVIGAVAAVVVDQATQSATYLLLGRLHPNLEYRLVPLTLIEGVAEEAVQLRIPSSDVGRLPRRTTA